MVGEKRMTEYRKRKHTSGFLFHAYGIIQFFCLIKVWYKMYMHFREWSEASLLHLPSWKPFVIHVGLSLPLGHWGLAPWLRHSWMQSSSLLKTKWIFFPPSYRMRRYLELQPSSSWIGAVTTRQLHKIVYHHFPVWIKRHLPFLSEKEIPNLSGLEHFQGV